MREFSSPLILRSAAASLQLPFIWLLLTLLLAGAAQAQTATLFCQRADSRMEAKFKIDFDRSEILYLDQNELVMWAAPAEITAGSIRWEALDFKRFPPNRPQNTGQIQNRSGGRWPIPPLLNGGIDRTAGNVTGFDFDGQGVTIVTFSTTTDGRPAYTTAALYPGTCKLETQKF